MADVRARCCWCQGLLAIDTSGFWWCRQSACQQKQAVWARGVSEKGKGPRWYYVPTPKQAVWHAAVYDRLLTRILVGGEAGPGKSKFLREAMYRLCKQVAGLQCLLLRKTYKDLKKSHLRFMPFETQTCGGHYLSSEMEARFPFPKDAKGQPQPDSVITCGHLEDPSALDGYLSAEYDVIAPDELVTFDGESMMELFTRARSSVVGLFQLRGHVEDELDGSLVLASSNPGGRGSLWVKDFFIDRCPDPEKYPDYKPERWAFYPAKLQDNPYLKKGYREALEGLPPIRRRQLLEGDWNAWEGQFFPEYRESVHVRELMVA